MFKARPYENAQELNAAISKLGLPELTPALMRRTKNEKLPPRPRWPKQRNAQSKIETADRNLAIEFVREKMPSLQVVEHRSPMLHISSEHPEVACVESFACRAANGDPALVDGFATEDPAAFGEFPSEDYRMALQHRMLVLGFKSAFTCAILRIPGKRDAKVVVVAANPAIQKRIADAWKAELS